MAYITLFQNRIESIDADDELHAAQRRIQGELLDRDLPRGATYSVHVAACENPLVLRGNQARDLALSGRLAYVAVAEKPGRGSTVARWEP